jgi:hypothetical protein
VVKRKERVPFLCSHPDSHNPHVAVDHVAQIINPRGGVNRVDGKLFLLTKIILN